MAGKIAPRAAQTLPDALSARAERPRPPTILACGRRYTSRAALVLVVSPSQRQSQEVFRRLLIAHAKLKGVPGLTQESALRAQFANGSRVLALPGSEKTTRGYAGAHMMILDEAARVPMTAHGAKPGHGGRRRHLIALSTPFGREDFSMRLGPRVV